jgi:hypothetical protein
MTCLLNDARFAELVAQRCAELVLNGLTAGATRASQRVDAKTVAEALGVNRDFVYDHATELGGRRLGDGPRARWRFDLNEALEGFGAMSAPAPSLPRGPRRRQLAASGAPLLPIRGTSSDVATTPMSLPRP